MPRLNKVSIIGVAVDFPSTKTNKEGKVVQTTLPVLAMHGKRDYGEKQLTGATKTNDIKHKGYDVIYISTADEETSKRISECKPYDIVEIAGMIRVNIVKKKCYCPECGTVHRYQANRTTVYPIYFLRRISVSQYMNVDIMQDLSQADEDRMKDFALKYLAQCVEKSNNILIIGAICQNPEIYLRDKDSRPVLTFPIAVKRHYVVPEDDMSTTTDIPFVKMYGGMAREEGKKLTARNVILVDGFLQSRDIIRKIECDNPECAIKFPVSSEVTEIVAYNIEYIREDVRYPATFIAKHLPLDPKTGEPILQFQMLGTEGHLDLLHKPATTKEEMKDLTVAEGASAMYVEKDIIDAVNAED